MTHILHKHFCKILMISQQDYALWNCLQLLIYPKFQFKSTIHQVQSKEKWSAAKKDTQSPISNLFSTTTIYIEEKEKKGQKIKTKVGQITLAMFLVFHHKGSPPPTLKFLEARMKKTEKGEQ